MTAFRWALIVLLLAASAAEAASCREEVGEAQARRYVRQCLLVSPATHPPCNEANPCVLIRDEIARGCRFIANADRAAPPAFCQRYLRAPSLR